MQHIKYLYKESKVLFCFMSLLGFAFVYNVGRGVYYSASTL